jgi:hypothetical protein
MDNSNEYPQAHALPFPATGWEPHRIAAEVEAETQRRTQNTTLIAWLLWLVLGGLNAHLAYLYPKQRALILVATIIACFLTLGLSSILCWLVSWVFLVDPQVYENYRREVRRGIEQEFVTRRALYGVPPTN